MPSSRKALCALVLLSCGLTLAASGDDFSLLRLVAVPADAVSDTLPLDDPNTDFVTSANASAGRRALNFSGDDPGAAASSYRVAGPISSNHSGPPHAGLSLGGHLARNELNPLLRC